MKVSALFTYPIKSCGSIAHTSLAVFASGAQYDRRWMLTDTTYQFLSQREFPQLALIQPTLTEQTLRLTAPKMPPLEIPLPHAEQDDPTVSVTIWRDTVPAVDAGDCVAEWLSTAIGGATRLVYMPNSTYRALDSRYAKRGGNVSFADGYPLLITTESSLEDLNRRMIERGKQPIPMSRFRPNIVIAGTEAWAEDHWLEVEIGSMRFDLVKPCARCTITTVDQATAQIVDHQEPLATLSLFRRNDKGGVLFGQNSVPHGEGILTIGERVSVIKHA